jgi:hypothetical protein
MSNQSNSPYQWDHEYRATIEGEPYPWPIRSQIALAVGHRFFLPLVAEVMMAPGFARPIWKPRLSPNFAQVEIESIEEGTITLRKIARPPQLPHAGERPT